MQIVNPPSQFLKLFYLSLFLFILYSAAVISTNLSFNLLIHSSASCFLLTDSFLCLFILLLLLFFTSFQLQGICHPSYTIKAMIESLFAEPYLNLCKCRLIIIQEFTEISFFFDSEKMMFSFPPK